MKLQEESLVAFVAREVSMGHWLQFDLRRGVLTSAEGYAGAVIVNGRVEVTSRFDDGEHSFFVRGAFYEMRSEDDFRNWLRSFDVTTIAKWAAVAGDFNVVVWNRTEGRVTALSDRTGAHRLYFHAEKGVVTVTSRLLDQARLQRAPCLDEGSVFSMLAFGYPHDPGSLLAGTVALATGFAATATPESNAKVWSYYTPLGGGVTEFGSVPEAVDALNEALEVVFRRIVSGGARPIIMLSGGIDSLIMLKYASRLAGERIDSLTFAIEGQRNHELREAHVAASYFGSNHHELILQTSEVISLARRSLIDSDYPGYGAFQSIGVRNYLSSLEMPLEVCRGEDTRLPSPAIDLGARIAIALHGSGLAHRPLFRKAWSVRGAAMRNWPIRRGKNYLQFLEHRTELRSGLGQYLLEEFGRFLSGPRDGLSPPPWVDEFRQRLDGLRTLDEIHHGIVELGYSLQYTEDMHCTIASTEFDGCRVVFPFMTPEFVRAAARVPVRMGLRSRYVGTRRTRSPIPFVDKILLRELLGSDAPEELRFRRKSTAPAMELCYQLAGPQLYLPLLQTWGLALLDHLPDGLRALVSSHRDEVLARGVAAGDDWRLGWLGLSIAHLATVARTIEEPDINLEEALTSLA